MEIEDPRYENLKRTALGDHEITNYLGDRTKVLEYNEIPKYSSLEQLLHPYNKVVILIETKHDFGHWICIKRTGDVISFFDSYGDFPNQQKRL